MAQPSPAALRRRRCALVRKLPSLERLLRGSLLELYKPCGTPSCRCHQGRGHGPKYYLTVSHPGVPPQKDYVPEAYHEQVNEYLDNYRQVKEILKEICRINDELLRRREPL
jgi:hypothetical protein